MYITYYCQNTTVDCGTCIIIRTMITILLKIKAVFLGWKNFIHIQKKFNKKGQGKQNKTKENYVQQTTIYNNHIDTQQINSSGTAYLLMC